MLLEKKDIRKWVESGLRFAGIEQRRTTTPVEAPALPIANNDRPLETNGLPEASYDVVEKPVTRVKEPVIPMNAGYRWDVEIGKWIQS